MSQPNQLSQLACSLARKIRIQRANQGRILYNGFESLEIALANEAPYIRLFKLRDKKILMLELYRQLNVAPPMATRVVPTKQVA